MTGQTATSAHREESTTSPTQEPAAVLVYTAAYIEGLLEVMRTDEETAQQRFVNDVLLAEFEADLDDQMSKNWRWVDEAIHGAVGLAMVIKRPTGLKLSGQTLFFETLRGADHGGWGVYPNPGNSETQEDLAFRIFIIPEDPTLG